MANPSERDLIALIYDSGLSTDGWAPLLEALPGVFGDAKGCFQFWRKGSDEVETLTFGCTPEFAKSYREHFAALNPFLATNLRNLPMIDAKVTFARDIVPADVLIRTEFYNDWMRPQGITPEHFGIALSPDPANAAILAVAPHCSANGQMQDAYIRRLHRLRPHLARAIEMRRKLAKALELQTALGGALDVIDASAFVLSPEGKVLHANASAQAMLSEAVVLALKRDATLSATNPRDAAALDGAIAKAKIVSPAVGPPIRVTAGPSGEVYLAWVLSPRGGPEGGARSRLGAIEALDRSDALLLLLRPLDRPVAVSPGSLQSAYGLSPAEARLTAALVAGDTLADYASRHDLARNTLRNQIASIFSKTGTSRQAELVARVLAAIGSFTDGSARG